MPAAEIERWRAGRLRLGLPVLLAFVMLTASGCGQKRGAPSQGGRPNVVLVVVDALRADRLHCYGYSRETSPSIDRLAGEGVLFPDAMAQGAETLNSVPLILSGRLPGAKGMAWRDAAGLKYSLPGPETPTLAELLRKQGYTTAMISVNPVLRMEPAVVRGFDTVDAPYDVGPAWVLASSDELNRRALAWFDHRPRPQAPFFVYLHYLDPHGEYRPPSDCCVLGRPGYTAHDDEINDALNQLPEDRLAPGVTDRLLNAAGLTRADIARLSDLYDDEVLYSDRCFGQLLEKLKELGVYDNTLIVVTADHGEAFLEHDDVKHRASLYQELLHVPLIIKGPGIRGGRRMDQLAASVDIAPTVLEALGVSGASSMSGRSLYGALARGGRLPAALGLAEIPAQNGYALRDGKLKLILARGRSELYDLSQDPGERHDLAAAHPEEVARLTGLLRRMLAQRTEGARNTDPLTPEQVQTLKSLGYLR
jgi:arylsulfatase